MWHLNICDMYEYDEDLTMAERIKLMFGVNAEGTGSETLRKWALAFKWFALLSLVVAAFFVIKWLSEDDEAEAAVYMMDAVCCLLGFLCNLFLVPVCHALATAAEAGRKRLDELAEKADQE